MNKEKNRIVARNKKARHDYFIEQTYEAGIELKGTEVKSIRQGKISIKEAYVEVKNQEAFLINCHISPYKEGNIHNVDPIRDRRLLLHKSEIRRLEKGVQRQGYTIVPLEVKIVHGLVKVNMGLAKGKKLYDKRAEIRKEDDKRRMKRIMRDY